MKNHRARLSLGLGIGLAFIASISWAGLPATTSAPVGTTPIGGKANADLTGKKSFQTVRQLPGVPTGPFVLNIIDRGVSSVDGSGAQSTQFEACVEDEQGNPGPVTSMTYQVNTSQDTKTGEMIQVFEGGQKANGQPGSLPKTVAHCRVAKLKLPPCTTVPGEGALVVTAITGPKDPVLKASSKSVFSSYVGTLLIDSPSTSQTAGIPGWISGKVTSVCGGTQQLLSAYVDDDASPVKGLTDKSGQFKMGPFLFAKSGTHKVHIVAAASDKVSDAAATSAVSVAPAPVTIEAVNLPLTTRFDTPTLFSFKATHTTTKEPLAGLAMVISIGDKGVEPFGSCIALTDSAGAGSCLITAHDIAHRLMKQPIRFELPVDSITPVTVGKTQYTNMTSSDGTVSWNASAIFVQPMLEAARPAGVMLNNYNTGGEGDDAYLHKGSKVFLNQDHSKLEEFDVPPIDVAKFTYYVDRVFAVTAPFQRVSSSSLRLPISLTGFDGRGPAIKGFCWHWYCEITGQDNAAPDFTDLKLNDSYAQIDLYVYQGGIVASLDNSKVNVDFTCGGVADYICGALRAEANSQIKGQMGAMLNNKNVLGRINKSLADLSASANTIGGIGIVTKVVMNEDGSITISGLPNPNNLNR